MRRVLTPDEIFISNDLPREWVSTPEWRPENANGDECGLYVSTLDAASKEQWESEVLTSRGEPKSDKAGLVMALALSRSCVDESGQRVFNVDQVEQLSRKSSAVIGRLWTVFRRLNLVTESDVSELVKN